MKVTAIIQARMTSTRLPGKVLMNIEGKPMLWHVINRLRFSKKLNDITLAIPNTKKNDILEKFAKNNKVKYFRGSEKDVLSRYYQAAKKFKCDVIVRITSDCPLVDPKLVDLMIEKHLNSGADFTSNCIERTFPKGLDIEIFNFGVLEKTHKEAKGKFEKEHVVLYMEKHPEIFNIVQFKNRKDFSYLRWVVDNIKDLKFIREIYKRLYKEGKIFLMEDVITFLKKQSKLMK